MMLKSSSDKFITAVRFAEESIHVERQFIRRSSIRQNCVRNCTKKCRIGAGVAGCSM